jgi:hypothetical protein
VIALATATLDRDQWRSTLDGWTSDHVGDEVTIEVLDPSVGHQYEAEKLPFSYLNYDPKDDVVIIAVGGDSPRFPVPLRHMVPHPAEVDVATEDVPEPAVRIVDRDGTTTLVTFFAAEPTS